MHPPSGWAFAGSFVKKNMGKIICLINETADGFVDSQYVIANDEFHEFVHEILDESAAVGFGRSTFELFQGVWPPMLEKPGVPEAQARMARRLGSIEKLAFSTTLASVSWSNSRILRAADAELVARYKEGAKGLLTIGSPGLVASLTAQGVVDEYYFCIQPVIAGGGEVRLFDKLRLGERRKMEFLGSAKLASGVNILHYKAVR
jgi:dihydrofolate reductase